MYDKNDIERLKREFDKNKLYILKKNLQRQNGIKITNNLDEILNSDKDHVITQELLQDCYLINGRKINMRVYVLYTNDKGKVKVYVYGDGFMYYTKDLFKEKSKEIGCNITTGYIDRKIYDTHPLTHTDFKKYLDKDLDKNININKKPSDILFDNINTLVKEIFMAYNNKLGKGEKLKDQYSFQLFGMDIGVNKNLKPQVMEINKGPDLNSKDERDGNIKKGLIRDIFKTIGIIENKNNKFILVFQQ
jgi:hypothetical protein